MSILACVLKALGQIGDPKFRRVLFTGIALTVALLVAAYALFLGLLNWLVPDELTLPLLGPVTWIDDLLSGASILLMLVLSVFLMIPVASAFTSFFLDDVTDAVEARHYPHLPPARRLGFLEGLGDALNFLGVLVLANLAAFALYLMIPPAAPFIFLAMNGYLLGREYFQLIAARRLGREGARALRRVHMPRIWLAGCVMALPLVVPILNLVVPVIGAATFTHLYHRLPRAAVPSG
ncbi:uncharacterized protein involved in cysteine biosynthesis [Palleronia aestuarii]|uniref:Uncharacterized protein involved in cysteine biosynthesis n=1 Tax=Palleronia aestuarii TaxID=568105 RepID=A0A2W7P882_9RHOB|nr:EI24 domain-containing protein [Palleronia aestuarii]PZX19612.1 uncharacterized protein involved in cysteine biosynthesis [Palleronia aestuarii]